MFYWSAFLLLDRMSCHSRLSVRNGKLMKKFYFLRCFRILYSFKYFTSSWCTNCICCFPCVKFLTEVINWLRFSFYDPCDLPLSGDWNVWHGELDRNWGACWNKDKGNVHWALPECISKLSMLSSPSMSDIIKLFLGFFILLYYWSTNLLLGYDSCYWKK